jgi:hypothetical protein
MNGTAKNPNRTVVPNKARNKFRWLFVVIALMSLSAASYAQIAIGISVHIGPPAFPVYAQPICPGAGYMWTPGYWAWNDDAGYYWVPGTWVLAPVGMLWTPGYWGWGGGVYMWHAGYWGPHIGFYGGLNYGFGYGGVGFVGGEWRGGAFYYNRSVTNVSVTNVTNVYNRTVVVNENHTAFNGGEGGVAATPTAEERVAMNEPHQAPLAAQTQQEHMASQNRANFASENHGRPAIAATAKPGDFSSRSAVAARSAGGEYHAPAMSPKEARASTPAAANHGNENHANESRGNESRAFTPPANHSTPSNNAHTESTPHTEASHPAPKQESKPSSSSHKSSPPPKASKPPKEDRKKGR